MTTLQSLHPLWMLAAMLGLFALGWLGGWCIRRDLDQSRARKSGYAEGYRDCTLDDVARRVRATRDVSRAEYTIDRPVPPPIRGFREDERPS